MAAVLVTGPSPTAAAGAADDQLWAGVDLIDQRSDRTRVVGWVAVPDGTEVRVRIVMDGDLVADRMPDMERRDAGRAIPRDLTARGWDVRVDGRAQESLCISVSIRGVDRGLHCWRRAPSTFLPALGGGTRFGTAGPLITYSIETEAATGQHPEDVARIVDSVLADPRSWAAHGEARFRRVAVGSADLRIVVATPATTDRLCLPFRTGGQLSCNKEDELVVFNMNRWLGGVGHWRAPLAEYRAYLVNHEVGHSLDQRHVGCPGPGQLAPVMMQQTKGLGGCLPNGWPYPSPTCLGRVATIVARAGVPTLGTSGDDVIVGTSGPDDIDAGAGDDRVCGLGGADRIEGGAGNDRIGGGNGADDLSGGPGADDLAGNRGPDRLTGGDGGDRLNGGKGRDSIDGGGGTDICRGGAGANTLIDC